MDNKSLIHQFEKINQKQPLKLVTFDFFDTLLMRKVKNPHDIFYIMEKLLIEKGVVIPFAKLRILSQEIAQKNKKRELQINDIYDVFSTFYDHESFNIENLKNLEIEVEARYLTKRKDVYNFINYLNEKYPFIEKSIISDMYLSDKDLKYFLQHHGIDPHQFKEVWVSGDKNASKYESKLIKQWIEHINIQGINANQCLHIGDHEIADIENFKQMGMNTLHCKHVKEKINQARKKDDFYQIMYKNNGFFHEQNLQMNILNGFLMEKTFNQDIKDMKEKFAHLFLFPFLLCFCQYLFNEIKEKKISKIYFLSRDGYLLKKAFDEYIKALGLDGVDTFYLLSSRRTAYVAQIDHLNAINLLNNPYSKITIQNLFSNRLGVSLSEMNNNDDMNDLLSEDGLTIDSLVNQTQHHFILQKFFLKIQDKLKKELIQEKQYYEEYLEHMNFFEEKNTAIVDIGYSGSIQDALNYLYQKRNKAQLHGFYLMTFQDIQDKIHVNTQHTHAMIGQWIDKYNTDEKTIKKIPLWETIFSSPEETFIKFEKLNHELIPVYKEQEENKEERSVFFNDLERYVIDDIGQWCALHGILTQQIQLDKTMILKNINDFLSTKMIHDLFAGLSFEDHFTSGQRDSIQRGYQHIDIFWYHELIIQVMSLFLSKSKKSKLRKSPAKFFIDSQHLGIRFLGKWIFGIEM